MICRLLFDDLMIFHIPGDLVLFFVFVKGRGYVNFNLKLLEPVSLYIVNHKPPHRTPAGEIVCSPPNCVLS